MTECLVCVNKFTKRDRKEIKCPYCEYGACRECCETYVLSQNIPKCMNCKKEWSKRFLRDAFTAVFLTSKYKEHVRDVIFEREKSFMPATQPYIERQKERAKKMDEIKLLHAEMDALRRKISEQYRIYEEMGDGHIRHGNGHTSRKYVRPCGFSTKGQDQACRGFMDENNECGICGQKACPKCDVFLNETEPHECKECDLETAACIRKETRPCPKCSVAIFKISGCDQMWCVQCHTAFSWNTGEIEERVHNPHYYEWMAQQAQQNNQTENDFLRQQREIYDGICANRLTHTMAHRLLSIATDYYYQRSITNPDEIDEFRWGDRVSAIIMHAIHMRQVDLYRYRVPPREEIETDNRPERIQYMKGRMTEQEFKESLDKKERKYEKYREYTQIIEMYLAVVLEITKRFLDANADYNRCVITREQINEFMTEYDAIRQHANKCFDDVSKSYFSVLKIIDTNGELL